MHIWVIRQSASTLASSRPTCGAGIVPGRAVARAAGLASATSRRTCERMVMMCCANAVPALEAQRHVGDPPAVVLRRRPGSSTGTRTSSRNTSQKWLSPSMVRIGRTSTPGLVHVEDQPGDALVLRRVGVGAHEQLAVVGDVGPRAPDLLAGDDVVVAVAHGARAQRGEVGAGLRLGEALAPDALAAQDPRQVERALLVAALGDQRRARRASGRRS